MSDQDTETHSRPVKSKAKKKRSVHIHIGPYAKAHTRGLAFCPVCDAERICRMTDSERELARSKRPERPERH